MTDGDNHLLYPDHILPHMAHSINKTQELNEDSHETISDEILIIITMLIISSWINEFVS